jgi:UV DNA damage repair endonuclease
MARETWQMHNITQCTHYSESRRNEKKSFLNEVCSKHGISWDEIDTWPTFAKFKKEFSKIKEQAHADYILDTPNTYGVEDLDIVVEAKAKELAILPVLEKQKELLIL